jgi:NAD+ synthase (glutamine-hydrolysing)
MRLIKVGAAVLNQTPFDWTGNKQNILDAVAQARKESISLLCLPELCITGYGCEDDFFREDLRQRAWSILEDVALQTRGMIVSVGLPVGYNNALFNCAALLADGVILGLTAKKNLAGDGIHYEPRWFESWPERTQALLHAPGKDVPIGDLYYEVGGVKIGFEICEDAWVGKRPGARLAARGVDIILNPSASHFAFGKMEIRKRLVLEGSRAFCTSYVYSNLLGNDAGRAIYDGGSIVASAGHLLAMGPRFSFEDYKICAAVIDVESTRMAQSRTYSFKPELGGDESDCIRTDFAFPDNVKPPAPQPPLLPEWETNCHLKHEELSRSVALGLFDYMRKSRASGYIVSLSGGADSSAVSCLVDLMIELACAELTIAGFKKKVDNPVLSEAATVPDLTARLLTCVYQGTKNSSPATAKSAKSLAGALGATFYQLDIDKLVQDYVELVGAATKRKLVWQTDDIALQNIQARVRSPGVWLLANLTGAVLLSTSNRSEGALGYCTMDGDTSGGLAPIAGIDKNFIRQWLRWLEEEGPQGLRSFPELRCVNELTPGPELRPPDAHQSGEQDLMPYDVLDAIEYCAIENNQSVKDCYLLMCARFPQYDHHQIAGWVEKFFTLWSRNQWKRERLAPALHVASRNLDPRTWRRSPILSGGFKTEIREMWECVKAHDAGNGAGSSKSDYTGKRSKGV